MMRVTWRQGLVLVVGALATVPSATISVSEHSIPRGTRLAQSAADPSSRDVLAPADQDWCFGGEESGLTPSYCDAYSYCSFPIIQCQLTPRTASYDSAYLGECPACQPFDRAPAPRTLARPALDALQVAVADARRHAVAEMLANASSAPRDAVSLRVSVSTGGVQALGGGSFAPSLSADGRFVVFDSTATNLVSGDTNVTRDVFVRDRQLGTTERVSVGTGGVEGNGPSLAPAVSADGRYVAYLSKASNLVAGDWNSAADVFVRDRQAGTTERVPTGAGAWPDASFDASTYEHSIVRGEHLALSADGRYVVFSTGALISFQVFLYDRQTGLTDQVTPSPSQTWPDGTQARNMARPRVSISGDGRVVAYDTFYPVVPGDTNQQRDVFVVDTETDQTTRVSVSSTGVQGNGYSGWPSLSNDGRFVVFASEAYNLVAGDDGHRSVFVHDRRTATTTRVPVIPSWLRAMAPRISGDGRMVVFAAGSGQVAGSEVDPHVFLFDRTTSTLARVSQAPGQTSDGAAFGAAISADGLVVAFGSDSTNLVAGDTNAQDDVFVAVVGAPTITGQPVDRTINPGQSTTFVVVAGGLPGPTYQWQVSTNGGAAWANLTNAAPYSGVISSTLALTNVPTTLSGARFRCLVTNVAGSVASAVVTLTVGGVTMSLDRTSVSFGAVNNGGSLTSVTSSQVVRVSFSGGSPGWTATPSQPWIQVTGGSGAGNGQFTVAVVGTPTLPLEGGVQSSIVVSATGVSNLPIAVTVRLQLFRPSTTGSPFGSFDTPVHLATGLQGSFAVTGWALDDIEVSRVEIWRDVALNETTQPVNAPGHPGHGKIFIANAFFVVGARPDVEAGFGTTPLAYRAGWGYLLLSWGLWAQGNGTYTLYAFAYDNDAHVSTLGTKTISVNNAAANRPFGGIDVPSYGQVMSAPFWNYGWALTPGPTYRTDPTYCTIANPNVQVSIDSGPLVPVTYGGARPDIATSFPGFSNGAAGGGAYYLNPSTLTNGTHTIGWLVTDDCGRADGIGSRFFTVAHGGSDAAALTAVIADATGGLRTVDIAPTRSGAGVAVVETAEPSAPLRVRRNLGDLEPLPATPGVVVVPVAQDERIEVHLPARAGAYAGSLIANGTRRALPVGSSLDAARGIFYWQPAPGFLGSYELEFAAPGVEATRLRVVIGPAMRVAIDRPAGGRVGIPFRVAGWALDLGAAEGSGIDAVHVWAHPVDGRAPIFAGQAVVGGARPDVAAVYGPAFEPSAFDLTVTHLPPGVYDLVVYPHRTATASFDGAQSVRVLVQ